MTLTLTFYFFALILLASSLGVILAPNPVQSALFLTLAFFNAAALWILLQAEFLAILLVLVYVGAVMVLFLFVVMMLDVKHTWRRDCRHFGPLVATVALLIITEMGWVLWHRFGTTARASLALPLTLTDAAVKTIHAEHTNPSNLSNTYMLGKLIYTKYIFAFEIAGLVLLVAMIAAIALALRADKKRKSIDAAQQIRVRREDRVRIVKC